MSTDDTKHKHNPTNGMWNCLIIGRTVKVEGKINKPLKKVYHASTATTLQEKGYLKILSEVEEYKPKTMEE